MMPHELINEQVDIFELPDLDVEHKESAGIQITIGDLHGNAMKLMFMLVKHGIVTNINEAEYKRLVAIYKTPVQDLTKQHLDEFNQILSQIEFNSNSLIRLIGDELADRGNNDYFTLKILEKLSEHKVPVEIIVSNHGIEFIEACEIQDNFHAPMLSQGRHAPSMEKLQILVEEGTVTREEILAIANKSYKPTLRAISYSLSEDEKEITIYSHAGIGLNTIERLAKKLEVEYKDATASELAQTIDSINARFQKHVQNNTVNTLYTRENMAAGYSGRSDLSDAPFEFIMWNRFYHHIDRPAAHFDYYVSFVHGHDSSESTIGNICNLDNNLGKIECLNQGVYTVLYSREGEMAPVIRPVEIDESDAQQQDSNEIKPTVITFSKVHQYFLSQLKEIDVKRENFKSDGHIAAAKSARKLYKTVKDAHKELTEEKIDIQTFKNNCTDAIQLARPELEQHRGWKQVLGNLALAIVGVGVLYVIAGFINKAVTGNFLFFKTDSANKIDQLEQSVKSIDRPK